MPERSSEVQTVQANALSCVELYARFWDVDFESWHPPSSRYQVEYCYQVEGQEYFGEFESKVPYDAGETFEIVASSSQPWVSWLPKGRKSLRDRLAGGILIAIAVVLTLYLLTHYGISD